MTSQKTISSLSIAALALLAIATPSLAQAQPDRDAQSSVATQASEATVVANTELIAATTTRVAAPVIVAVERTSASTRTAPKPRLTASSFKLQNNFTSAPSSHFVTSLTFNAGPSDPTAKKQFRADDDKSSSERQSVSFVPSRGPKLPE